MIVTMQNNLDSKSRCNIEINALTSFNWSKVLVTLVEMGFMTNQEVDAKISQDDYQNKIVESLSDRIDSYFSE